ncbi:unnamed protein product [Camellia sinensis]
MLPSQQSLHRQHKGFSKTYRQWTASVSSQRNGKPYELRSNRKRSMAQLECKDEYEVLETSKDKRSSYPAKGTINSNLSEAEMAFIQQKFMADHGTFGQVLECLDNENLEHLAMMERLLGPLPQHMIISADIHDDGRPPNVIARLMGLDRLPSQQSLHRQHKGFSKTYRQWTASVSSQRDGKPYELRSNRKRSMAQLECKDEYEVLETSKDEMSSYPAKRTINSNLPEAEMAFIQQKFMADHDLRAEKYFKRSARLDWLEGASSKERTRAVWKLPRLQSHSSKFKCFSGILRCLLCIGSLPIQPSDPTTDIPTTTTTFEKPKQNFNTQVKTPRVVARLMGLDSLPDPKKIDGLPHQQPLHRQHKGFSETYKQWTASVSSQRDGKPFEH